MKKGRKRQICRRGRAGGGAGGGAGRGRLDGTDPGGGGGRRGCCAPRGGTHREGTSRDPPSPPGTPGTSRPVGSLARSGGKRGRPPRPFALPLPLPFPFLSPFLSLFSVLFLFSPLYSLPLLVSLLFIFLPSPPPSLLFLTFSSLSLPFSSPFPPFFFFLPLFLFLSRFLPSFLPLIPPPLHPFRPPPLPPPRGEGAAAANSTPPSPLPPSPLPPPASGKPWKSLFLGFPPFPHLPPGAARSGGGGGSCWGAQWGRGQLFPSPPPWDVPGNLLFTGPKRPRFCLPKTIKEPPAQVWVEKARIPFKPKEITVKAAPRSGIRVTSPRAPRSRSPEKLI